MLQNCGEFGRACDLVEHEQQHCPNRELPCKLGCGRIIQAKAANREAHFGECERRFEPCPLKCGINVQLHHVDRHTVRDCPRRKVECDLCGETVGRDELEDHQHTECAQRRVLCGQGCGERLHTWEMEEHKASTCSKRIVKCTREACELKMPADALEHHLSFQCRKRDIYCYLGCGKRLPVLKRIVHEKECPRRLVLCDCGEMFMAMDHEIHLKGCSAQALNQESDLAQAISGKVTF